MAGQKNWEVDQNSTFTFTVKYKDSNGSAISLVGATAKMQVRDNKGGSKLAFTLTSGPNGGIVIDGLDGKITVTMEPAQTNKLFYPKSAYDLILTDSNGVKTRMVEGFMTLSRSVTI